MKPLHIHECVPTPDGYELVLYQRDDFFVIRINGYELMSSRAHGSEDALALMALAALGERAAPRVLVGGLGMGFTLRATLDALVERPGARVEVVEVFNAVVRWNRGPLAHLAGEPLADPRVVLVEMDIGKKLAAIKRPFDVILLDVDNGPDAVTLESNHHLYGSRGLERLYRALTPGGVLAVWSAGDDQAFTHRLRRAGFAAQTRRARARTNGKGPRHVIFVAQRPEHAGTRRGHSPRGKPRGKKRAPEARE